VRTESQPIIVIEPSSAWRPVDLREVWQYRELLFFFVWRDVKVRYKQTVLGITWAVIQPLFAMVIFAFFFGRIAKLPSDGLPYPLFAYAGLLPWTLFANAVTNGSNSLISSSNLVTKVYFPRILVPIAAVTTGLVDFALALLMLVPLMLFMHFRPSPAALIVIPVSTALAFLTAAALATWLSALVVRFRDLRHVVPFLVQLWMFATPIIYPLSMVPAKWRWLVNLNPMAPIVEAFRGSLSGRPVDVRGLEWAAVLGVLLIISGSVYFRRLERLFADTI
jgi:lipopolysaccharide transport system permease protein